VCLWELDERDERKDEQRKACLLLLKSSSSLDAAAAAIQATAAGATKLASTPAAVAAAAAASDRDIEALLRQHAQASGVSSPILNKLMPFLKVRFENMRVLLFTSNTICALLSFPS